MKTVYAFGLLAALALNGCGSSPDPAPPPPTAEQTENADRVFSDLQSAGVITSISISPSYTYVMVGHPFELLTYNQKVGMAAVMSVYSRAHGGSADVAFKDAYTNKKIAYFVLGQFHLE